MKWGNFGVLAYFNHAKEFEFGPSEPKDTLLTGLIKSS